MKNLINFKFFESNSFDLTPRQKELLDKGGKYSWKINPNTGLVDIYGYFSCSNAFEGVKEPKIWLELPKFGTVKGNFECSNLDLFSLDGAPQSVTGCFYCQGNDLTSLVGLPQDVKEIKCGGNPLQTLDAVPFTLEEGFSCEYFQLKKDEWNIENWISILTTGVSISDNHWTNPKASKAKRLMATLPYLQPDWWNSELKQNPGKTIHMLAPVWKNMPDDMKSKIKIPPGYEDQFDLFSGFDELGLF